MVSAPSHRRYRGFSLIELIVVVALMGIMITMAIPSMGRFLANQQARTSAQTMLATLMYARSEAVKRNATIRVDAGANGWADGWRMVLDTDNSLIRRQESMDDVTITEAGGAASVSYNGRGRLVGANALSFTICDSGNRAEQRLVQVDLSGRPKVTKGALCP